MYINMCICKYNRSIMDTAIAAIRVGEKVDAYVLVVTVNPLRRYRANEINIVCRHLQV